MKEKELKYINQLSLLHTKIKLICALFIFELGSTLCCVWTWLSYQS